MHNYCTNCTIIARLAEWKKHIKLTIVVMERNYKTLI